MENSKLFKAAHKLTRETLQQGDNYQVTFAACLKKLIKDGRESKKPVYKEVFSLSNFLGYMFFVVVLSCALSLMVCGVVGTSGVATLSSVTVFNVVWTNIVKNDLDNKTVFKGMVLNYCFCKPSTKFRF